MKEWIRTWKRIDIDDIAKSLLVVGVLNAECFSCHKIGLPKDSINCPNCGCKFRYIGFRNKATHRELENSSQDKNLILIDFDDFLKEFNRKKAKRFLNP